MDIKKVIPIGEFSLGRVIKRKETTDSGLALPDDVGIETYDTLEVLEVGEGRIYNDGWLPVKFNVGDLVLIFRDRYDKIKTLDGEVVLFRSTDVSAIIE